MNGHKLSGCISRMASQTERAQRFLDLVAPVLPENEEDPNRQFLYQSMVVMLQSFFEEYLRCVVAIGTFWKTEAVRQHLAACYSDQDFSSMGAPEVGLWAQKRVSFDERATRLKGIFGVLFGVSPFQNEDAEQQCLDFVAVRNLIVHRGGWPDDAVASSIRSNNVIVRSDNVSGPVFYRLAISGQFFREGLTAISGSMQALERALTADPAYSL